MRWQDVPIPEQMMHLPKDRRGYPVPFNALIDRNGQPHFAINPEEKRQAILRNDLCSICGKKLLRGRWMVGGPASAFHKDGAYNDPPVHHECGRYALQVCPYLAMPSYTTQVGAKSYENSGDGSIQYFIDPTLIRNRPEPFVMVMYVGQTFSFEPDGRIRTIRPKRPHRQYEYWSNGEQLSEEEGLVRVADYLEQLADMTADPSRWEVPKPIKARGAKQPTKPA